MQAGRLATWHCPEDGTAQDVKQSVIRTGADIRLMALDVDGTLLDSRHELTARTIEALQAVAERGILVVLATGRRTTFVRPIAEQLPGTVYIIASNGAIVRPLRGDDLFTRLLPRERARQVVQILDAWRRQAVVTFPVEGAGELIMEDAADALRTFPGWLQQNLAWVRFCEPLEDSLQIDPVQLMYGGTVEQMEQARRELLAAECSAHLRLSQTVYPHRDLSILDVLDGEVNKGAALARLSAMLGIEAGEIMAIGDNFNDIDMLEFAGTPVLMGNASAELDRPGWHRTRDNDHDGVAWAVEELVLKRGI